MEYKVIPFVASIDRNKNPSIQVAEQLEDLIKIYTLKGWKYIRLESVTSLVKAESGCFGLSQNPAYTTTRQIVVFSKE